MSNLDKNECAQQAPVSAPVNHHIDYSFLVSTEHAVAKQESGIATVGTRVFSIFLTKERQNIELCANNIPLNEDLQGCKQGYKSFQEYTTLDRIKPRIWQEQVHAITKELLGCLLRVYQRFGADFYPGSQSEHPSTEEDEEAKLHSISSPLQQSKDIFKSPHLNTFPADSTMIFGIIPQELHEQLLDLKNYQNRTNGVEELKNILFECDLKPVSSESIVDFISFLRTLLDDSNFKVLYGTLQVINLLIKKLDCEVEKYLKQIVSTVLKTLGDTHTISRNEYMNVFRQLMKIVGPQKVLDLVIGHLKHKNSRVREDVINIIIAAMLTHPRKDFNIPSLCLEVAPCLADRKKRVRHAALELFALFDYCLDTGKKQPLMRAVDKVELSGDVEGLMAAVQARRARHILPRLSSEGTVEYALVIPKPGQRPTSQFGSGADLEWVQCGGRIDSARSNRTEPSSDRLYGYGSLGSLTDNIPLHRRILSAGKNKLPWERSRLPATGKPLPARPNNSHSCEQISSEDSLSPPTELSREAYVTGFVFSEPHQPRILGRKDLLQLGVSRKSGSIETDRQLLETNGPSASDQVMKGGRPLCRPPSVERTLSLPTNTTPPGNFLLPSYPLAKLPSSPLTPRVFHRHAESTLSLSSTWPNKRENSPHRRDPSPWREIEGDVCSDQCSPLPLRASLVRSSSTSSCRQALTGSRPVPPIPQGFQDPHVWDQQGEEVRMTDANTVLQDQLSERKMNIDLSQMGLLEADDEPVDREEMMNSLRSLRNSAAKKRAKVSLSGSDPDQDPDFDSPDSAVKLELALDSLSHTSPSVTSPLSESGLSSLYSPPTSTLNGTKTSPGTMSARPWPTRVSSGKQKTVTSVDCNSLPDKAAADVSVIGQRVAYSNGPFEPEGDRLRDMSPPPARPSGREPIRAMRPARGSQTTSSRVSPAGGMTEGVVGKGVFGSTTPLSSSAIVAVPQEQHDTTCKPGDLPEGVYGHAVPGSHHDTNHSPDPEEPVEKMKLSKSAKDKMRQRRLEQQEILHEQAEQQRVEKVHQGLRQSVSHFSIDELDTLKDWQLNGNELMKGQAESPPEDSPSSSTSPQGTLSPVKSFSPHHQPSPPTLPPQSKTTLRRVRRAPSLNKTRPSFSNSSDDLFLGSSGQKKDDQDQPELRPFSSPDAALIQAFTFLSSNDWEKKIEGMTFFRCLVQYHSDVISTRLQDVCRALIPEVMNLRSGVSRVAVATLGSLYTHLQRGMDQELEVTATALLHKVGVSNTFIRHDVDAALDSMVQNCTHTRVMNALLTGGVRHLNSMVRKCTAQHLADLVEKIGAGRLLSGSMDLTDRILPAIARLAQDSSQEARYYGRQMLLFLASHQDFDKMVKKYIPAKDLPNLRDLVFTLKTKGLGEMPQDTPSARGRRSLPGSGTIRASSLPREPLSHVNRESAEYNYRAQAHNIAERTEYIKQLKSLMSSKDFRERIKAIDQVVGDCENNPDMVIVCIFPVFDAIKARLQESNSKVNLHALEALQKIIPSMRENLAQVVNILVPAIVDNHLNSKNNAIYSAAVGAVDALMQNIDNALLLQIFVTKAQLLSGRAKVNLVDKVADLVTELYPHKPLAVEQKVLPLLWNLLSTSSNSGTILGRGGSVREATATLCQALYTQMGPKLTDCAASQSLSVTKSLNQLLKTSPPLMISSE